MPLLARTGERLPAGTRVVQVGGEGPYAGLLAGEAGLLRAHTGWGCLCLVCEEPGGGRSLR